MPSSLQARITLKAISPLFAISMLVIFFDIAEHHHRLILPCFFHGLGWFLFESISSALISIGLVSVGSITKSMVPFSAAIYGFANLSRYSFTSCFFLTAASAELFSSLRWMIVIAASGPNTAISAVGHA